MKYHEQRTLSGIYGCHHCDIGDDYGSGTGRSEFESLAGAERKRFVFEQIFMDIVFCVGMNLAWFVAGLCMYVMAVIAMVLIIRIFHRRARAARKAEE